MNESEDFHVDAPVITAPERIEAGRIPEDGEIDIEDKQLPEKFRFEAADAALTHWRDILSGVDDYAVFASTAMYLQGKEKGIRKFVVPPGDLDAVVMSEQTLERIRERLVNVPGVEWKNDGAYTRFAGEDGKVLAGTLRFAKQVGGKVRVVRQPFEFYYKSFILDERVLRDREPICGVSVLGLEGLQRQYGNNLRMELRKKKDADTILDDLASERGDGFRQEIAKWKDHDAEVPFVPSAKLAEVLQRLQISYNDLARVLDAVDRRDAMSPAEFEAIVSKALSGQKTKTEKRAKNLRELQDAQRIEL